MVQGISDVQSMKCCYQQQSCRRKLSISDNFGNEAEVQYDPAYQARPQLTEELQVNWTDTRVQLTTHEEVIDDYTYKLTSRQHSVIYSNFSHKFYACFWHVFMYTC